LSTDVGCKFFWGRASTPSDPDDKQAADHFNSAAYSSSSALSSAVNGNTGDHNWAGYGSTYFWIDPKERLVAVWVMQSPNQRNCYRELYRNMVYGALD
jgi:CubicO group peptidase (beta-lactamase class C family)